MIQELEITIESKNKEIEELNSALDKKHQSLLAANDQLKEVHVHNYNHWHSQNTCYLHIKECLNNTCM